jgi:hypothetical protein
MNTLTDIRNVAVTRVTNTAVGPFDHAFIATRV